MKRVVEVGGEKIDGEDATPPVKEDGRLCDQMASFASLAKPVTFTQCHQISALSSFIHSHEICYYLNSEQILIYDLAHYTRLRRSQFTSLSEEPRRLLLHGTEELSFRASENCFSR